ncbi:MAG: hypothetical protein D6740_09470 [Alphaproteobacteria bacterium]|nr:MAG: hypothetical protein D6740_09470 [Alphaproteobacteria bacterium]
MIERTRELPREVWREYFDALSKVIAGHPAEIEVESLELGDQVEASWVPLIGITYDHKDDVLEVALEGVDHLIRKPSRIWVEESGPHFVAAEVERADGVTEILRVKEPIALPAPETQQG